jgi:hypothetical protein
MAQGAKGTGDKIAGATKDRRRYQKRLNHSMSQPYGSTRVQQKRLLAEAGKWAQVVEADGEREFFQLR